MRVRFHFWGAGPPSQARRVPQRFAPPVPSQSSRLCQRPLRISSKLAHEEDRELSAQQRTQGPLPGQDHPVHKSALRSEWGQHIYSTGKFPLGLDRLGCAQGVLKLYSQGPIEESMGLESHRNNLRRLFQTNTDLLAGSLWSTCYYLYLIALHAIGSRESSRDVYAQISSLPGIKLESLNIRQRRLPGSSRTWKIFCRLGKSDDGRNILSRPLITFRSGPASISNWCSVKVNGVEPPEMTLFLLVMGSLKANHNRGQEVAPRLQPQQETDSVLQSFADGLATECMYAVIGREPFATPGAVISTLRQKLLSYLPSSPIAAALDLNQLSLTLQLGSARSELVQNIFLNHDGSAKTNFEMPSALPLREDHSTISSPSADSNRQPDFDMIPRSNAEPSEPAEACNNTVIGREERQLWKFSDSTHGKLGHDITWDIKSKSKDGSALDKQRLALHALDQQCQDLDASGIALITKGASRMYKTSPPGFGFSLKGFIETFEPLASANSRMTSTSIATARNFPLVASWHKIKAPISVSCNPARLRIVLSLPGILGIPIKLGEDARNLYVLLGLSTEVSRDQDMLSDGSISATISNEISFLTKAAEMVIGRVCQATTFANVQACAETCAEAILRFLNFRSLNLPLSKVRFRAIVEDGPAQLIEIVSTATPSQEQDSVVHTISRRERRLPREGNLYPVMPRPTTGDTASSEGGSFGTVSNDHDHHVEAGDSTNSQTGSPAEVVGDLDDGAEAVTDLLEPHNVGLSEFGGSVAERTMPTEPIRALPSVPTAAPPSRRIYIALGSNVGDRIEAIESACRCLDEHAEIRVAESSPLYETEPMYVENQDRFLNGVCEIITDLRPNELLDCLQAIEIDLGRHKTIDKGPRNIDLDILTYGQRIVTTERLVVPHALMLEREFVLRPLCDTLGRQWYHPSTRESGATHLRQLPKSSTPMYPLTSLGAKHTPLRSLDPKRKTQVMSILNVTPDSFSDGGVHQATDLHALKATILANIAAGATIIDIGGQSSRPNAQDISAEDEIARILPAIELIRSLPEAGNIAISIDTYRAAVAEAAVNAGAHIVNDISAGLLDPEMLPTVARLGCTYIMMHMRGTPATMQNEENTFYPDGLIPTITRELGRRLEAAQEAGIRRWRIILDPGFGFAKTLEQNVELLRNFGELRNCETLRTYPWLVGTSRKGFIGKITGVADPKDRVGGTAATVTAAVQGGAEIVRVHDVKQMVEVVKMADAMYRT